MVVEGGQILNNTVYLDLATILRQLETETGLSMGLGRIVPDIGNTEPEPRTDLLQDEDNIGWGE